MTDLAFEAVSKQYLIRQDQSGGAAPTGWRGRIGRLFPRRSAFLALRDISFQVERGQAVGIIGHNGAGKSTALKLLSGITAPSAGRITIAGRIAALLEVGSGFHPELTGRENVFLSGCILGMTRREIRAKIDSIIEFAEVRPFIDVPVKRYSSGMYVRLGFSIAAHLNPEILLLDEVLAVGDAAFQQKCLERILELKRDGMTIMFVSHDLSAVERLCDRVLVLQKGRVVADAAPGVAISEYTRLGQSDSGVRMIAQGSQPASIAAVSLLDENGARPAAFSTGRPLRARVEYVARERLDGVEFRLFFVGADGHLSCQFTTALGRRPVSLPPGQGAVEFECAELSLQPGVYRVDATIENLAGPDPLDWLRGCAVLQVHTGLPVAGVFYHPHTWRLETDLTGRQGH